MEEDERKQEGKDLGSVSRNRTNKQHLTDEFTTIGDSLSTVQKEPTAPRGKSAATTRGPSDFKTPSTARGSRLISDPQTKQQPPTLMEPRKAVPQEQPKVRPTPGYLKTTESSSLRSRNDTTESSKHLPTNLKKTASLSSLSRKDTIVESSKQLAKPSSVRLTNLKKTASFASLSRKHTTETSKDPSQLPTVRPTPNHLQTTAASTATKFQNATASSAASRSGTLSPSTTSGNSTPASRSRSGTVAPIARLRTATVASLQGDSQKGAVASYGNATSASRSRSGTMAPAKQVSRNGTIPTASQSQKNPVAFKSTHQTATAKLEPDQLNSISKTIQLEAESAKGSETTTGDPVKTSEEPMVSSPCIINQSDEESSEELPKHSRPRMYIRHKNDFYPAHSRELGYYLRPKHIDFSVRPDGFQLPGDELLHKLPPLSPFKPRQRGETWPSYYENNLRIFIRFLLDYYLQRQQPVWEPSRWSRLEHLNKDEVRRELSEKWGLDFKEYCKYFLYALPPPPLPSAINSSADLWYITILVLA